MSWMDDPRALNQAGTYLDAGSAIYGVLGKLQAGDQARKAARFQADQMRVNAGQEMAAAQRNAAAIAKQEEYLTSAAIASAAGSGGGAGDPTVVGLIARNASEMAYRKAVALYEGQDRARSLEMGARAKEYEGELERADSRRKAFAQTAFGATSSLLMGYARDSSLMKRFGGDGPQISPTVDY